MTSIGFFASLSFSRREITIGCALSIIALLACAVIVATALAQANNGHILDFGLLTRDRLITLQTVGAVVLVSDLAIPILYFWLKSKKSEGICLNDWARKEFSPPITFIQSQLKLCNAQSSTRKTFSFEDGGGHPVCFIKIRVKWQGGNAIPIKKFEDWDRERVYCEALAYQLSHDLTFQSVPETYVFLSVAEIRQTPFGRYFEESFLSVLESLQVAKDGGQVPFILQQAVNNEEDGGGSSRENQEAYHEAMLFNWIAGRSDASQLNSILYLDGQGTWNVKEHDNEILGLAFSELDAAYKRGLGSNDRTWILSTESANQPFSEFVRAKIISYSLSRLDRLFQQIETRGLSMPSEKKENIRNNLRHIQYILQAHPILTPQELCFKLGASEKFVTGMI